MSDNEVQEAVHTKLQEKTSDFFINEMQQLVWCWSEMGTTLIHNDTPSKRKFQALVCNIQIIEIITSEAKLFKASSCFLTLNYNGSHKSWMSNVCHLQFTVTVVCRRVMSVVNCHQLAWFGTVTPNIPLSKTILYGQVLPWSCFKHDSLSKTICHGQLLVWPCW